MISRIERADTESVEVFTQRINKMQATHVIFMRDIVSNEITSAMIYIRSAIEI